MEDSSKCRIYIMHCRHNKFCKSSLVILEVCKSNLTFLVMLHIPFNNTFSKVLNLKILIWLTKFDLIEP
jgi:hypothetical protein